jgi:hypothetical protein
MPTDDELNKAQKPESDTTSERRSFLKQVAATMVVAGVGNAAYAESSKDLLPTLPVQDDDPYQITTPVSSQRILKHEHTSSGACQETTLDLELIGNNGVKQVTQSFTQRIDSDQEYAMTVVTTTKSFKSSIDSEPARIRSYTTLIHGKKGSVQGDFRSDEITITLIQNGSITKQGPLQKNVRVNHSSSGMSDQQMVEEMLNRKLGETPTGGSK